MLVSINLQISIRIGANDFVRGQALLANNIAHCLFKRYLASLVSRMVLETCLPHLEVNTSQKMHEMGWFPGSKNLFDLPRASYIHNLSMPNFRTRNKIPNFAISLRTFSLCEVEMFLH